MYEKKFIMYRKFFEIVEKHIDNFDMIVQYINSVEIPYSYSAFSYNFKKDFDMTIKDYYIKRRLSRICEEIKKTKNSILEIALKYGYLNQTSLNSIFLKYIKMTPLDYRNTDIYIKPFLIDINDQNIQNKIMGLPYEDAVSKWIKKRTGAEDVKVQHIFGRLYDYDVNNKNHDDFDLLVNKIIDIKTNNDYSNTKIRTTRLNKIEKKVYENYFHNKLLNGVNPFKVSIKRISLEMGMTYDEIKTLITGFNRHEIEITFDKYVSNSRIFCGFDFIDEYAQIRVCI